MKNLIINAKSNKNYIYYSFQIEINGEKIFQMVFIKSLVNCHGVIGVKW